MDKMIGVQSIIITLDVDASLFDKLNQIIATEYKVVEINCIEQGLLRKIIQDFPTLKIGAGNIINTQQLEDCYQAGVSFVTSPGFLPALAHTAMVYTINYLPGIATISEAMQAMAAGCQHVRPYPATISLCHSLSQCLPLLKLFPADIACHEIEQYLKIPAVAAVSVLNPEMYAFDKKDLAYV